MNTFTNVNKQIDTINSIGEVLKKTNEDKTIFPTADYEVTAEDNLMVIAPNKEIEKMGWM